MRRAVLYAVASALLVGCASNERTDPSVTIATTNPVATAPSTTMSSVEPSPSTTVNSGAVKYSSQLIGELPGAVDLIQRQSTDAFFYVVSRNGTIERWRPDGARIDTVMDISTMTKGEGEQGLLGLAFRRLAGNWEGFTYYTDLSGSTVISRFDVTSDGVFSTGGSPAGTTILTINQPYPNHNGGAVVVGPDNMLYVGMGDGGSANDPERRALNLMEFHGKILRIDPRSDGYDIPSNNPYVGIADARPEIWSIGVRNPWRFNFDTYGNIWIADVGQATWDEVSVAKGTTKVPGGRGASFGWSAYEGSHRFNEDVTSPKAVMPVHEYEHTGGACSISGSAIGSNSNMPGRAGWYFYGDYCTGVVTALLTDGSSTVATEVVATNMGNISAVRGTFDGMFVLSIEGKVHRLLSKRP